MEPLDLRKAPPRGCREELDGLILMPRTIDKLRSQLPGGNCGEYFINRGALTGFSGVLLMRLGITEEALQEVVAGAQDDEDVAAWLRANTDTSGYEKLNTMIADFELAHSKNPAIIREIYGETIAAHPELTKVIDIIDADDRRSF
jgi:Domain of unknown function (DUF5069)